LVDRERLIKRTQLKRSLFNICGKSNAYEGAENVEDVNDRHLKDYDEEIFDDTDFYNQLLREVIDRKSSNISDPVELSRRAIELQKLRSKKKNVDTKASKGRKIKFEVHKPLVNFMAPIHRNKMPEEARYIYCRVWLVFLIEFSIKLN
jgi:protein AATF/BFR2